MESVSAFMLCAKKCAVFSFLALLVGACSKENRN